MALSYQKLLARHLPATPGFHDPSKQYLFKNEDNEFLVDWDTLGTWPQLLKACQDDNIYLFKFMDTRQACCCIRIIKSKSAHFDSDEYLQPILGPNGCVEDKDSDRLLYHLKIYEFATFYKIKSLQSLSFHYLKLAGDQLGFVYLAGILSKQNFQFNGKDSLFISYMRERAKMHGEILSRRDRLNVGEDWKFSKTLENFLLGTIVDMKMEIQQLKAAAANNNDDGP
ncbi:hypothetical protein FVEN_g11388 [Fusarium venenatum]|uniref:BTB domain-containing protein n=1 Tax=Fusarium venenatum TaxID=56646 RepID=A0A2L2T9T4_9HYPO|nr:uncharacterized protein FVRRES_05493 [Fusarium venenatum]KAG8350469.1 hypothetical protein FVEN_g11388 [Fusarium venenatum]CEI61057.1 unnamed protein product [Fusarium venenatum]